MNIGDYLKNLRQDHGWTQKEAAERAGIHHATISAYERNAINIPSDKLELLAELYGVSPGEIINASGVKPDIFKTLKLTVSQVKRESGIADYQALPDLLKSLLASAAMEAVREFYNSLPDK